MAELFASGNIVLIVLALIVLEVLALVVYRRRTGRGPVPGDVLPNIVSGACLFLALRAALLDSRWPVIAAWLVLALAAHLVDLKRRWT